MTKIEKLTEEQEILLEESIERNIKLQLNCDPLDMSEVEPFIEEIYKRIDKAKPIIFKYPSPRAFKEAIPILKLKFPGISSDPVYDYDSPVWDYTWDQLWDQLKDREDDLAKHLKDPNPMGLGIDIKKSIQKLPAIYGEAYQHKYMFPITMNYIEYYDCMYNGELVSKSDSDYADHLESKIRSRMLNNLTSNIRSAIYGLKGIGGYFIFGNISDSFHSEIYKFFKQIGIYKEWGDTFFDLNVKNSDHLHIWYPMEGICVVIDRPEVIHLDESNNLHNMNGPAVQYRDGWSIYAINGVAIPEKYFTEPVTVDIIDQERNAEISRKLIERYGLQKYIEDSKAEKIAEDEWGILYRKEVLNDEPIVMVSVLNSTPEEYEYEGLEERLEKREFRQSELGTPGKYKRYMLRVPPDTKTPLQGLAWMANMTEEEYIRLDCES